MAACPKLVWFSVPSASCTISTSLSTAYTTASAKWLTSAMKLSPTRMGMCMQFGQVPTPLALCRSVSPVESPASPVPWP